MNSGRPTLISTAASFVVARFQNSSSSLPDAQTSSPSPDDQSLPAAALLSSSRCRLETGEPTSLDANPYTYLAIAFNFIIKKNYYLEINVSADSNHSAFTNFSREVIAPSPTAGSTDSDEPNSISLHQLLSDAEED